MTQEQKWLAYVGELRVKHETEMKIIAVGFVEYIRDRAWEHEYRDQKSYSLDEHYDMGELAII